MSIHTRFVAYTSFLLLVLACQGEPLTEPDLAKTGGSAPLTATPGAFSFLTPDASPGTITASVQFVGTISATSSDRTCAAVTPASAPATKPKGSSVYVATFTVQPVGPGSCVITVADKQGHTARISVQVRLARFPGKLVWTRSSGLGNGRVYLTKVGADPVSLTPAGRLDFGPTLSPDGTRIAFSTVPTAGSSDIATMKTDGSDFTTIVDGRTLRDPTWAPDGSRIAYATHFCCVGDIGVVNADGTGSQLLTSDGLNGEPAWSPDGSMIAFESVNEDTRRFEIHLMAADGSNPRVLAENAQAPAWSPDGTRIAFASVRDGNAEIYVMNSDGSGQTRLTDSPSVDYFPAWSPDGSMIAFESERDGNTEIYIMKTDGTGLMNLTNSPETDSHVSWR